MFSLPIKQVTPLDSDPIRPIPHSFNCDEIFGDAGNFGSIPRDTTRVKWTANKKVHNQLKKRNYNSMHV